MLKNKILDEIKVAMRNKEKQKLLVLRTINANIKQKEIDEKIDSDDDNEIITILNKMVKQRNDSVSEYVKANRLELAEIESYEISVIESFLPKKLSEEESLTIINNLIKEVNPQSMKDMGKIMTLIKNNYNGLIDPSFASKKVKELIS